MPDGEQIHVSSVILDSFIIGLSKQYGEQFGIYYNELRLPSSTTPNDLLSIIMWHYGIDLRVSSMDVKRLDELATYLECEELMKVLKTRIALLKCGNIVGTLKEMASLLNDNETI